MISHSPLRGFERFASQCEKHLNADAISTALVQRHGADIKKRDLTGVTIATFLNNMGVQLREMMGPAIAPVTRNDLIELKKWYSTCRDSLQHTSIRFGEVRYWASKSAAMFLLGEKIRKAMEEKPRFFQKSFGIQKTPDRLMLRMIEETEAEICTLLDVDTVQQALIGARKAENLRELVNGIVGDWPLEAQLRLNLPEDLEAHRDRRLDNEQRYSAAFECSLAEHISGEFNHAQLHRDILRDPDWWDDVS